MKTLTRYARSTIEIRALKMLRTLSASESIRKQMEACGYTAADHEEGWNLCITAAGYVGASDAVTTDGMIRSTIEQLKEFVTQTLPCLAAGVRRVHPEHYDALFNGILLGRGEDVVLDTTLFLDHYAALEGKGAKKAGHAVVAFLAKRGLSSSVVASLKKSTELARSTPANVAVKSDDPGARRDDALLKLAAWVDDWATTARRAIDRKDQLHRLGIGRRAKRGDAAGSDATPAAPGVTPAAPGVAPSGGSSVGAGSAGGAAPSGAPGAPAGGVGNDAAHAIVSAA